ncbi:hypothetical protein D3C81_972100 [compost metagenome]
MTKVIGAALLVIVGLLFRKLIFKLLILGLIIFLVVRFIKKKKGFGLNGQEDSDNDNNNNNNINVNVVNQLPKNDDESHAFTRKN